MKNFNLKSSLCWTCIAFTIATFILMFIGWAVGWFGVEVVCSFISIALMCTFPLFQLFWFGVKPIKKASYGLRIAGFGITYLAVLIASALVGNWMPFDENAPAAWGSFLAIFAIVLAAASLLFDRKFKKQAGSYQAALDAYKRSLERHADEDVSETRE